MPWFDPSTWFEKAAPELPSSTPLLLDAPAQTQTYAPAKISTPENPTAVPADVPIGTSGLRRAGGYVYEELLVKLSGQRAARVYREMSDNSPIVGAVLYVIEMFLRQVEWRTEPAGELPRQKEAAEFLDECLEDMTHTWDELLAEVLSMLPYGWGYFETVFKKRMGPGNPDPHCRSRFSDGRIGLRKIAIRSQDTLQRWEFDQEGTVIGLWQQDPFGGAATVYIPLSRSLLFRTTSRKANPEGRSILRNAYRPWWFGKRLEEIEAIGIERDLAGLPIVYLPAELMSAKATPEQKAIVANYSKLVQQIRRDEREGIVFPSELDAKGAQTGYKFALLTSGGRRSIDTGATVTRHEQRVAMTMLAEFIFLGTQNVGSWSLASTKASLFSKALGGHMENIASTFNRTLIPRLMGLNGYMADEYPKIVYGDLENPDLTDIATFINQLVQAGVLTPDSALERKLREMAGLPQAPEQTQAPRPVPGAAAGVAATKPGAPAPGTPKPGAPAAQPKPAAPTVGPAADDEPGDEDTDEGDDIGDQVG